MRIEAKGSHALSLENGQVGVIWSERDVESGRLPRLTFIINDSDYLDFIAWTSTYIGTFSPFTSFFRVIRQTQFHDNWNSEAHTPKITGRILERLAPICVAEAVLQTGFRDGKLDRLSLQACRLTLSYTVLTALMRGLHPADVFGVEDMWKAARRLTSDRSLVLDSEKVASFWVLATSPLLKEFVSTNASSEWMGLLSRFISTVATRDDHHPLSFNWGSFEHVGTAIRNFESASSLPRERQIKALDAALARFLESTYPEPLIEATLGYLVARLSGGSFDYLNLTREYEPRFPGTAMWFAFFAVWQKSFDGMSTGASLGRKIANSISSSDEMFSAPTADLSLDEFLLTSELKRPRSVRTKLPNILEIELYPNVSGYFPNPYRRTIEDTVRSPIIDTRKLSRLLREAISVIEYNEGSRGSISSQENLFREVPDNSTSSKINKRRK